MIIKGKSVAGGRRLAVHLARTDTNERMEVVETRGVIADDLAGALKEMEAVAAAARDCQRPFYHASLNAAQGERLTKEQRNLAIDRLEQALGLEGQPRVVVAHVKADREHFHVVWSRLDLERMRVISDSHNYRRHEEVARALERELGHAHVQGAHVGREGRRRPERTPSHDAMQQAARTGIGLEEAKAQVAMLWRESENGAALQAALAASGWALARGDRRDFVVIDRQGGVHSLGRTAGVKAADVRRRLADLDREAVPSVADVRAGQRAEAEQGREAARQRQEATAAHSAARGATLDAVRLAGSQSMAKLQAVQLQRMRRSARAAEREFARPVDVVRGGGSPGEVQAGAARGRAGELVASESAPTSPAASPEQAARRRPRTGAEAAAQMQERLATLRREGAALKEKGELRIARDARSAARSRDGEARTGKGDFEQDR